MSMVDLPHLLWVLDRLADGEVVNRVTVPAEVAADARVALERMVAIQPARDVTTRKPA
jgi:quinolinate synthase